MSRFNSAVANTFIKGNQQFSVNAGPGVSEQTVMVRAACMSEEFVQPIAGRPGAGKTYEMWVIPKAGPPRPAGLFQSDGMRALHILSGPVDVAAIGTVAVTIEPAAGSATPTMPIVIAAPIGS